MSKVMRPVTSRDTSPVIEKFFSYIDENRKFADSLKLLIEEYTVCLVGGSIRDIINHTHPRDFDLIIDTDNETLKSHFSDFITKRNSFGGLKCVIGKYTIDIWSFNDNWAFRTGLLDKRVENIPRGAFYNIDALTIDLSRKVMYYKFYNECVNSGVLDFVSHEPNYLDSNPTPAQNALKSYYIFEKYKLDLSEEVLIYIDKWKNSNKDYIDDIIKAEIHHFGKEIYNEHELQYFFEIKLKHENPKLEFLSNKCSRIK